MRFSRHAQIIGELIQQAFRRTVPAQHKEGGFVNATAMCKAHGKMFGHYKRFADTKDFVAAFSRSIHIRIDQLMQNLSNVPNEQKGTWVHPTIAIHLAMWCPPDFAV